MNEELEFTLEEAKEGMQNALHHLEKEIQKLRAGKASPQMLDGVKIDYYGVMTPVDQTANISSPDARQIIVQPWDKSVLSLIEKAIQAANLGFNPKNEGEILICPSVVKKETKKFDRNFKELLGYLVIHGMLHLKGMEHSSRMDKEEKKYDQKYFGRN